MRISGKEDLHIILKVLSNEINIYIGNCPNDFGPD
jgi:hypothetical protein